MGPFGSQITLGQTDVWNKDLRIQVRSTAITLDDTLLKAHLRMISAPNSVVSQLLDPANQHHVFVKNRRLSMAAATPLWVLLGALLGLLTGRLRSIFISSAAVGVSYWVLRLGELSSRAGELSPFVAAWLPTGLLAILVLLLIARLIYAKTLKP